MAPRPIIIDCDPGQDDAVALFLAMSSPDELDLLGITTVAGNVPLELTQRNARMMCDLAQRQAVPVYAGCEKPMVLDAITAEYIHGNTGIDGVEVFDPETPLQKQHAVDYLIETLLDAEKGTVTLIPTGPMTNIATAIKREPRTLEGVREIVSMGGAMREAVIVRHRLSSISWSIRTLRTLSITAAGRSQQWASMSRTGSCRRASASRVFENLAMALPKQPPIC